MGCCRDFLSINSKLIEQQNRSGGKAANLAKIKKSGMNVPDFFVISANAYKLKKVAATHSFQRCLKQHIDAISSKENQSFAVRSSATYEDSAIQSFAGQLDSFLRRDSIDDVTQAVEKVWESTKKKHVKKYTKKSDHKKSKGIAVLVQRMVNAQYSGVIFTADPITNDTSTLTLEVVKGGCENLVNGTQSPQKIVIKKSDLSEHKQYNSSSAEFHDLLGHPEHINSICRLALQIDDLFSFPQDIEWSFDGNTFWILQSRPISTFVPQQARIYTDKQSIQWSDYFFAERFTEPVSPLGWSFLRPVIQRNAFENPLYYLGFENEFKEKNILALINGIPHARLSVFKKLYESLPKFLISPDKRQTLNLVNFASLKNLFLRFYLIFFRLTCTTLNWFPVYNIFRWREFNRSLSSKLKQSQVVEKQYCFSTILKTIKKMARLSDEFLAIHSWSITFADIFFILLKRTIEFIDPKSELKVETLLTGFEGNETVLANIALYNCNFDQKESRSNFVEKYGHRAKNLDVYSVTWAENLEMLKNAALMIKENKESPADLFQKSKTERHCAELKLIQHCSKLKFPLSPLAVGFVKLLLYFSREFMLMRENQRNAWQKILATTRNAFIGYGQQLYANSHIENIDDIFFLTKPEIEALNSSTFIGLAKKIKYRKNTHQSFSQRKSKPNNLRDIENKLTGIGVSAGTARGPARVCKSYDDVFNAQRGDILVVPSADPAWSPVFGVVAGMIMETGGVLSHASIVAREFRMPTVTNVKNATHLFNNGDSLEIDGTNGIVSVLS
jgi:rifampicin phosphotransferase